MRKSELRQKIQELNDNLNVNCCANEITIVTQRSKSNILPQVKLYKDKIDAFRENSTTTMFTKINKLEIIYI